MILLKEKKKKKCIRKTFERIGDSVEIPNLIKVQKDSYEWFVKEGLGEVLKDISPIIDYTGNLVLEFFDYYLEDKTKYTIEEANIDDDLLIIAGDNLFTFKLRDFVDFQKEKGTSAVCVKEEEYETLKRLGVVETDENQKIIGFEEKPAEPKGRYAAYAEYLYPKEVIPVFKKYLEEGNNADAPGNFVAYLYKHMPVYAFPFEGQCYDVGTHESLAYVNKLYTKNN